MFTGERQSARIRKKYLQAILRQDVGYFDVGTSTGEIIERMSGDIILVQEAVGEKFASGIHLYAQCIAGFIVAFIKGWLLTLILMSAFPLLAVSGMLHMKAVQNMSASGQQAYAEAGSQADQTIGGIRTVQAFVAERRCIDLYTSKLQGAYRNGVQQAFANGIGMGMTMCVMFFTYAMCLWVGSRFVADHRHGYDGGNVSTVLFGVIMGGMSLGQASPSINSVAAGKVAAYKMFQVLERKPDIDIEDTSGKVLAEVRGQIELKEVEFTYPSRPDVKIFDGFSLVIPAGNTVALVGESGSGKSTVVSLIERFYDPQRGQVCVDGVDIRSLQLKWWRQQIGLVSQEPVLFATTIAENVAYGKEGASREEIVAACKRANAHEFVKKLPKGYETEVGDLGTQLSGGQKQRVAIARAILRNPRVLLLDEATSALDTRSEKAVQEALDRIMSDRTTVVVAHRLSTVQGADLIAVVQRGKVVEMGRHQDLIAQPAGAYSALVRLQKRHDDEEEHDGSDENGKTAKAVLTSQISLGIDQQDSMNNASGGRASQDFGRPGSGKGGADSWVSGFLSRRKNTQGKDVEKGEAKGDAIEKLPDVPTMRVTKLSHPDWLYSVGGFIGALIMGLVFPAFGIFLSGMLEGFYGESASIRRAGNKWGGLFLGLSVLSFAGLVMQFGLYGVVGERLVRRIRIMTYSAVLRQEIGWFDEPSHSSGEVGARLSTDATLVRAIVNARLAVMVQSVVSLAAGLVIALAYSWQLTLVVLCIVPLLAISGVVQMKFMQGFSGDAKVMFEQASRIASNAVGNIRTVAAFGSEQKVLKLYSEKSVAPENAGKKRAFVSGAGMGFSMFVICAAYALTFWYGSKLVRDKKNSFGDLFTVFFAIVMSAMTASQAQSAAPDVSKVQTAVNSIYAILDRKPKIDAEDASGRELATVAGTVEFEHVRFAYPMRPDVVVLKDFSLQILPGKTAALVGESGSGKSTAISLMERFYDPDAGCVLLDGHDLKTLQLKWLRQQIGLVSQEPVLFAVSIRENILYGKPDASDEEIERAAMAANAHSFITALPGGYDTQCGERGVQLSGGQKQRVAIARAIIKDPKILLLDEATSALDAESERVVQEALDRVMVGRTTVVVAHRLSTVRNADMIAVVKGGEVVEKGTHEELLAVPGGAYGNLVKLSKASN
ncbi:hypothetical protein CBR_g39637 [Chara braunii]|uniref:Uncharacterized protein n=1 Tax=Chara braunii TaxID=69332 RepID=A0A388K1L8_CHABU|nr:hypothetical protein CBR_g39637 [Chara braunii]|eukprot:GBG63853.1 hypothetical protein CBR_g39637 [Chara braunii]